MKLDIEVEWRTIDTQGPQHSPTITKDTIFYEKAILLSDIYKIVEKKYGGLVDNITIIEKV